jgi:hypothetical protein
MPGIVANSLFFVVQNRIRLGSRFAVGGIDNLAPKFAAQLEKSALYFTLPAGFTQGFEVVECDEGAAVVFQGIFLSPAEHEYLDSHGPDAFEERLHHYEGNLNSLNRSSSI